jgi:hypothetical protein
MPRSSESRAQLDHRSHDRLTMVTFPPWVQPGITNVTAAQAFLEALRAPDTLVLHAADSDVGYPITRRGQGFRGHCAAVCPSIVMATPPPPELTAYHRTLGLGPERVVCPTAPSARAPLSTLLLEDADAIARVRADRSLERMMVAFKDRNAALLVERLGLVPVYCDPSPAAYEVANDKLSFARAGPVYGFETLPIEVVRDETSLEGTFRALAGPYGDGCIVRLRRGAGGHHLYHARTLGRARRLWRQLAAHGDVLFTPYVPPELVVRNVATHGIVTDEGFAPLAFSDQLIRARRFRGGRVAPDWEPAEITAVSAGLAGVARWFRELGYTGAPAGVDGFLLRDGAGPRFVAIDPNARMSGTMMPWAVVATLAEAAGRPFLWQFEYLPMLGVPLTFERVRRRLGEDLLRAHALERGGILPSSLTSWRLGPLGASGIWTILLAHGPDHMAHLRGRVRSLALIPR